MPKLKWLDDLPKSKSSITWGVPWKKGDLKKEDNLALRSEKGEELYVQSWPLAYWPDGSIKWSAQSAVFDPNSDKTYEIIKTSQSLSVGKAINIEENDDCIIVDTSKIKCKINKSGKNIIEEIMMNGKQLIKVDD